MHQPRRCRSKAPAHTIDIQTPMSSVGELQLVYSTRIPYHVDHGIKVSEFCYRNSNKFFIFQQDSARRTGRLSKQLSYPKLHQMSIEFKNSFKSNFAVNL